MLVEAIVIKKNPTREHDQLVTLYCRELGKTTGIARSILKAHSVQALQLDEGNLMRCELVPGKGSHIITGAQAVRCYSNLKASPAGCAAMQFFLQIVDTLVYDHQQDEALFACLTGTLAALDRVPAQDVVAVFRQCQRDLLGVLGYGYTIADISSRRGRTDTDDLYEQIAQKKLGTIDLFYEMVS